MTTKKDPVLFGEEEIVMVGCFPLRKEGSLKISELNWMGKAGRRQIEMAKPLYALAKYISQAENISEREALAAVQDSDSNPYYALKYADQFAQLVDSQHTDLDQKVALSLMMLNSRVSKSFLAENSAELFDRYGLIVDKATNQIKELGDLPEAILDEILEFNSNERNKWKDVEYPTDEELTLGE